jgi:1-pyrroline-5-carboxylate dehydrogenase
MSRPLAAFKNEVVLDFKRPEDLSAAQAALKQVRAEFGRDYELWIAGERHKTGDLLNSTNPAKPSEIVGRHHRATRELANRAIEDAHAYFPEYSRTPAARRIEMAARVAEIIRERKFELDAWLVAEAGKTWPEADADVSEAIDFCEYYARQMHRLASPEAVVQMPGEHDEMIYLPLGAGVIIPPWNFPLAIMAGMTVAALVTGNTVVIKPSSETPTIAAKFAEILQAAGFPPRAFALCTGSGASVGDVLVEHVKTRFVSFTGSRDVGLRINELAAKPRKGQLWIKRVIAEMGGKDAIVVDREADLDSAVTGVVQSAYGYQGQKCSACSRAIVDQAVYDQFLEKLKAKVATVTVGAPEDPASYMGPVISAGAKKTILEYIEVGKKEGRLIAGGAAAAGEGHFVQPTVIADVDAKARIFQEEIFGPVLAVTKARDFGHALELANDSEYGLTGAVYSNNPEKIKKARAEFFVGNLYINRKCTGAMVGAHPFGGFNMSGTDSKAGGPDYLLQFLQPKSIAEKVK